MKKIARKGSIQDIEEIPAKVRKAFVTSMDIDPEWHVKMQAAFQKFTDNAVSKTINFSNSATPYDVEKAYMSSFKIGCKGITIYRYGSRDKQVLNIDTQVKSDEETLIVSEDYSGGCPTCTL